MEESTCPSSATDSTTGSEFSIESTTATETIDATRINDLLDFVRKRLTTDIYGNFTLQGNRMAKDGRHTQLREVVQLADLLDKVKNLMERGKKVAAAEAAQQARKVAKPNANQAAIMRDVLKEEVDKALRDVKIETDRLRDRLAKTEDRAKKAEDDRAALQESIRKMSSGQLKGVRGAVKEEIGRSLREIIIDQSNIKERITETETEMNHNVTAMEAQIRALEETLIKRLTVHEDAIVRQVDAKISVAEERARIKSERSRPQHKHDLLKPSIELTATDPGPDWISHVDDIEVEDYEGKGRERGGCVWQ